MKYDIVATPQDLRIHELSSAVLHPTAGSRSVPRVLQSVGQELDIRTLGATTTERRVRVLANPEILYRLVESGWEFNILAAVFGFGVTSAFRRWMGDNGMLDDANEAYADSADTWASVAAHAFDEVHELACAISDAVGNPITSTNLEDVMVVERQVSTAAKLVDMRLKVASKVHDMALRVAEQRNRKKYGGITDHVPSVNPANIAINMDFGFSARPENPNVRVINQRTPLPGGIELG